MLHFVTSYMKQNKRRKQTLESAQNGLEIIFKALNGKAPTYISDLINVRKHTRYSLRSNSGVMGFWSLNVKKRSMN